MIGWPLIHRCFSGAARTMSTRSIQLILDFDGTLTQKDTLHIVAEAGYSRQRSDSGTKTPPPWQEIVDAYMSDFQIHNTQYSPSKSSRNTLLSEVAWLDSLQDVEKASAERVNRAGVFDNVTKQDMESAAASALEDNKVMLRPGWTELLVAAYDTNSSISQDASQDWTQLVSVNWSRWFIWSVVWKAATLLEDQILAERVTNILHKTAVYANEVPSIMSQDVQSSASVPSPAGKYMTLRTAGDKLKHMQSETPTVHNGTQKLRVYIGDSTTDLACLALADVGICIRDRHMSGGQKDLQSTCERVGILLKSLSEYKQVIHVATSLKELEATCQESPTTLYYAHDLHEVADWIRRITSTAY